MSADNNRVNENKPLDAAGKVRVQRAVERVINTPPSRTDPFGSYTGKPVDYGAVPVQDADDL